MPTSALISDDLPTFDLPAKAISGGPSGGRNFIAGTPRMKTQLPAKYRSRGLSSLPSIRLDRLFQCFHAAAPDRGKVTGDPIDRPVPPRNGQEPPHRVFIEPAPDDPRGIARHNR